MLIIFELVHLDFGAERAREEFDKIFKTPAEYFQRRKREQRELKVQHPTPSCPGEVQAKKADLKAAAKKWFPYGYGPARGDRFVIEEIGHVSDDEEDYGEYQYVRNEQQDEMKQQPVEFGRNWFDEYQLVRTSKKVLGKE